MTTTLVPQFTAATSRFAGWKSEYGVPVRTTVGAARGFRYPHENIPQLAPFTVFRNRQYTTVPQMIAAYTARLDGLRDEIITSCNALARQYHGERLVFLCFDDVQKPGEYCHRTWCAAWFRERFDMVLPELTDPVKPCCQQSSLW